MNPSQRETTEPLKIALPKGRLFDESVAFLRGCGMEFSFGKRELVATDAENNIQLMMVKNSDLPVYVHHGIAGLGICGSDVTDRKSTRLNSSHYS